MDYIRTKASNVENAKLFGTEIGSGRQSEGEREKERERERKRERLLAKSQRFSGGQYEEAGARPRRKVSNSDGERPG